MFIKKKKKKEKKKMPRKTSLLKSIAKNYKGKATNSATCGVYRMMWEEEPPKGKKKVKSY